ncbi:MAG: peptidoglycan endopeptidase, partial [Chthoniobacterales bacterium]
GIVKSPISSSEFRNFGAHGQGKWITVYARNGHTFATIAGLRLDTTPWNTMKRDSNWAPRWQPTPREPRGFEARHPAGL